MKIGSACRRPLFKHACVIVCMRVCVPVAHVKMKLTISKTYKLVLLHVAACCVCITVSNCIIKQHNLRGHPFITSTKNQVFDPPPHCPHGPDPLPLVDVQTRSTRNTHCSLEMASTMTYRT